MRITFDPSKRDRTLAERGLDFAQAGEVFRGQTLTLADERFDYGEARFQTYGIHPARADRHGGLDASWRCAPRHLDEALP